MPGNLWCEAIVNLNQYLKSGTYSVSIDSASMCVTSNGLSTIFVYGCLGSGTQVCSEFQLNTKYDEGYEAGKKQCIVYFIIFLNITL